MDAMKVRISILIVFLIGLKLHGQERKLITEKFNGRNLKFEYHVLKSRRTVKHGDYKSYWYGNILKEMGKFYQNHKDGEWIMYDNQGQIDEIRYYDRGTKIGIWQKHVESGQVIKRYDHERNHELKPILNISYRYPALARDKEIEGIVKINYELDEECDLRSIDIVESLEKDCDKSAIEGTKRMINLMKKYDSAACDSVSNTIEIKFELQ